MNRKRYEASRTPTQRIEAVRDKTAAAKRLAREAPTLPPPEPTRERANDAEATPYRAGKISGMRPKKRPSSGPAAAVIDEVTADMSKDPRHDDD